MEFPRRSAPLLPRFVSQPSGGRTEPASRPLESDRRISPVEEVALAGDAQPSSRWQSSASSGQQRCRQREPKHEAHYKTATQPDRRSDRLLPKCRPTERSADRDLADDLVRATTAQDLRMVVSARQTVDDKRSVTAGIIRQQCDGAPDRALSRISPSKFLPDRFIAETPDGTTASWYWGGANALRTFDAPNRASTHLCR